MQAATIDRLAPVTKPSSKSEKAAKTKPGHPETVEAERRVAGGAATGGGINFQAAVTAIAYVYTLRGRPLRWLDGVQEDVPVAVAAETGGGGDDIQLILRDNKRCDVQAKRGLRCGDDLWKSLVAMGTAIADGKIDFGVLAVSPSSSKTVREELANAILRIGEGRTDNLPKIAKVFLGKLTTAGLTPTPICRGLRVVTIAAAAHDGASVQAAQAELGHVCRDVATIGAAWNVLYRDAVELIDHRGRRELSSLVQLLKANSIALADDAASPASLLSRLADWTIKTNATFSIFGVKKPLRLSEAWIPLRAVVHEEQTPYPDLITALNAYQAWHNREYSRDATSVEPETLGRFIKLGVLVAGPGMGKTTLLSRVAQAYANDGIPVLRVRLVSVAARMRRGETFEEAIFADGLAGSGISPHDARTADIRNWVLLCDGLDETGTAQTAIASAAERFTQGYPDCRVIVTTRPVGYRAGNFGAWRHYDIVPLDRHSAHRDLARLLREIGGEGSRLADDAEKIARAELEEDSTAIAVVRSPLLLALGASVIAQGGALGVSRCRLYEQLFSLVDEAPNSRMPEPPAEPVILRRFLDVLGWQIVSDPTAPVDTTISKCAEVLAEELGVKRLVARAAAQSYLRYWQDVGLIERIGLQGTEALTFLHKTFGEFAAARFLVAMPTAERTTLLPSICDEESWSEVLDFAAKFGISEEVCTFLMDGISLDTPGISRVVRCLEICGEAEPSPSKQTLAAILDYAAEAMQSPRRGWATEVGIALLPAAQRFPDEVVSRCTRLISHPQSWTRLGAWAALAKAGPPHLDFARLQTVIQEEPSLAEEGMWPRHGGRLVLGRGTERDLAQAFVLAGARQLLEHYPGEATDKAVVAACRIEGLGSMGFLERAQRLLKEFGKPDDVWPKGSESPWKAFELPLGFLDAQRKAYAALFDAIDEEGSTIEVAESTAPKLLHLSAFLYMTRYLEFPVSDVWHWQKPFDQQPVRETLRAAVEASGIPRTVLEHEIRVARSTLTKTDMFGGLFKLIAPVDVTPIDWRAAVACNPDIELIEAALYHRSSWLVSIAASLLKALTRKVELQSIVHRAIASGRGEMLWEVAKLAVDLDKAEMTTAIYDRLHHNITYGCDALLLALPELEAPADFRLLATLETAFLRGTLDTAMAASKVVAHYASPLTPDLIPVLERAAAYWKAHEEPYPASGGVIPNSPRSRIAEASAAIRAPSYETLKQYSTDSRRDVRELGEKMLVTRLIEQPHLASAFLTDIEAGELTSSLLDQALTDGVSWESDCLARVKGFLTSARSDLRYAAMAVLRQDYCSADFIRGEATRMTKDSDGQIRERAYRILDTL